MSIYTTPDLSGLSQGISTAGSALAQALGQRNLLQQQQERQEAEQIRQQQLQNQQSTILGNELSKLGDSPSPIEVTKALSSALQQGVPSDVVQKYGSLYSTLQKTQQGLPPGPEQITEMANLFEKFGMDKDSAERNAELWGKLTTGGQTEMAKVLVDQITRQQFSGNGESIQNGSSVDFIEESEEFKFPKVDLFEDRTPKERASLKSELLKENNKEYKEISQKIQKIDGEKMRYEQLERLNESGKLPSGIQLLNVNWTTGDLRIPQLANAETQLFVKTINDFTVAAKDSFGARVTNFELGAFLKRLPTLANTEEGRRLILAQMKAIKDLDSLYESSIKKVYDKYGLQKIDRSTAERIAEDYRKDEEESLKKDFANAVQAQEVYEAKQIAPEGKIPVRSPEGKIAYVWRDQADKAQEKGYEPL